MNDLITQIFEYAHGMWRYKWSALLIAWILCLVGWIAVYAMPDQFETHALVYIDTQSIMKPLLKGIAVETDDVGEVNIVTRALIGRENIEEIIREADLDLRANTTSDREELIKDVTSRINITGKKINPQDKSIPKLYEIKYQGDSPKEVYRVVNLLVDGFVEDLLNSTRTDTSFAQKFLDEQITKIEHRLTVAEQKLAEFKKKNVGFMPDERGGYYMRIQRGLDEIDNLRTQQRLTVNRRNEIQRQLKGEAPIIAGEYVQGDSLTSQVRAYENELSGLLTRFTEDHPDVRNLKIKLKNIKDGMVPVEAQNMLPPESVQELTEVNPVYHELKVELNKAELDIAAINLQLAAYKKKVEELQKQVDIIPQVEAELAHLNRDYQVTQERYINLVERRESARLAQQAEQNINEVKFRIIEPPITPLEAAKPNRLLFITGVLGGGLLGGMGWSFLLLQFTPTVNGPRDFQTIADFPVLGIVGTKKNAQDVMKQKVGMTFFMMGLAVIFALYIVALIYREIGASMIQSYVSVDVIKGLIKDIIPI